MESKIIINTDPNISTDISKVLLVHDRDNEANQAVIDFYTAQGYHVHSILLSDDMFRTVNDFNKEFEPIVRAAHKNKTYTFGIVHFCANEERDLCMYCDEEVQKNTILLRQAFACLYVTWGREKCALITAQPCCPGSIYHLPHEQVEGMVCYYDYLKPNIVLSYQQPVNANDPTSTSLVTETQNFWYPQPLWEELQRRLEIRQLIESHKKETKHVLLVEKEIPVQPERPLTGQEILDLIGVKFQGLPKPRDQTDSADTYTRRLAFNLGMKGIPWEEHVKRSGAQALVLCLKRTVTNKNGFEMIAKALDALNEPNHDIPILAQLCRDYQELKSTPPDAMVKKELFLSSYSSLQGVSQVAEPSRTGPWKDGVEKPVAEAGTHLDKVKEQFIPPYLRNAIQMQQEDRQMTTEEKEALEQEAKRVQELDRKYQKHLLEQEIHGAPFTYVAQPPTLTKKQGGQCPI